MPFNTKIRRLLKFHTYIKQNSFLLKLSLEIIYDIVNRLPLSAIILLSQTCRDLWYLLRGSTAMQKVTSSERLELLATLGYILPYYRLCGGCNALHIVDPKDVPKRVYDGSCKECIPNKSSGRVSILAYYAVEFHHVQLAIKYTRLGNIHQHYRARILQKYTKSKLLYASTKQRFTALDFTAEPVIVQSRFIMMETFVFRDQDQPLSITTFAAQFFKVCPHLPVDAGALRTAMQLAFDLDLAGRQPSLPPKVYSCDRCPTDYLVTVQRDRPLIQVWQDFGSGTSPTDPYWRSHVW